MHCKTALVTGGAQRIGAAIVGFLARQGYDVAIHYQRSADEARACAAVVEAAGQRACLIAADLADEAQVRTILPQARAALGPVGVLINNAAIFEDDTPLTAERTVWDRHMAINLRAPFVLAQEFAAPLLAEQQEGVVINLLDQRVFSLTPYFTSYTLSKTGLWTLTQTLALAWAPHIRVVGIGPGPVLPSLRQTDEQFAAQCRQLPLQRQTQPEEIAAAVGFILASPSLTGQMLALDGGQHLQWSPQQSSTITE